MYGIYWDETNTALLLEYFETDRNMFRVAERITERLQAKVHPRHIYVRLSELGLVEPVGTHWPDEWTEHLKSIYRDKSSAKIADEMTEKFIYPFTKNTIIGRMTRLGLKRQPPVKQLTKEKSDGARRNRSSLPRVTRPRKLEGPPPVEVGDGIPMSDLEFPITRCRWPVGHNGHEMTCCGHQVAEQKSYCPYHFHRSLQHERPRTRPRKANRLGFHPWQLSRFGSQAF
jgi:hypothetical protein